MQVIQKIEVFKGLTVMEAQRLLKVCQFKTYESGEQVYGTGDPSLEMLILLQGKLKVTSDSGKELGEIVQGTATGEMGLFTGLPRSANITAMGKSSGFAISRRGLDSLMEADRETCTKILRNVLAMLSHRLQNANNQIEGQAKTIQRLQEEMETIVGE